MADTVILPPLNPRGVYDPTVIYNPNDQVIYFGVPYYCRIGTVFGQPITPGSDPNTWQLISIPGDKGEPGEPGEPGIQGPPGRVGLPGQSGAGYRPRGIWDAGTAYFQNDSVIYANGAGTPAAVWFAVADSVNVAPGSNPAIWGLGVKGDTGDVTQAALDAKAAALASQQAAHTSELNAGQSETNAGNSATAAGQSATAALASKNAAGQSETNAGNSATAAGQSATAAAASKTAAGQSETNAGNSATAAGQSAAAALASKNAAGTSETNAGNSAAAAAASAAAAAGLNFGVPVSTAAAAVALDQTYIGKNVKFTGAGASVFTSLTAAQLAAGRALMITNDGTATITLTAQGSDKFNYGSTAVTSLTVLPGEWLILHGTGVANGIDVAAGSVMLAVTPRVRINQTADDGVSALQVGGRGAFTAGVGLGLAVPVLSNDAAPKIYIDTAIQSSSGFRNRIRNGDIRVAQRAAGVTINTVSNNRAGADGWVFTNGGAGGSQNFGLTSSNLGNAQVGHRFTRNWQYMQTATAVSDLSGSKYLSGMYQTIPGVDSFDLVNGPMTLSLLLYSTKALPAFPIAVRFTSADATPVVMSYVTTVNLPAGSLGFYVINIPALPAAFNAITSASGGCTVYIGAQNGGAFVSPTKNAWAQGNYLVSADASAWSTSAGTVYMGDVQLEAGTIALPSFERIPYQMSLSRCQHFFCKTFNQGIGPGQGASSAGALFLTGGNGSEPHYNGVLWKFPQTMRTVPALTFYQPVVATNPGTWYDQSSGNASAPGVIAQGDSEAFVAIASATSVTIGASTAWYIHATADADL